uniref:Large ribosomal subunit protein bL19m n=1 Tax=Parastrongyloides trichosuri TaxID=131310 RepID=A0A0N4Z700_PARTI
MLRKSDKLFSLYRLSRFCSTKSKTVDHYDEFPEIYPDFAKTPIMGRRNALREKLERLDMLNRRMNIDIPEFYVGSIVAVTTADANLTSKQRRFVGICIRREKEGLKHSFTLRNVVDGLGVEVMYELYNPSILKIETLKLEKRLDNDLSYLVDCLPEYSTFDFNLEPIAHPAGAPIPVNETKVELRPPPWTRRWELFDLKGVKDSWNLTTPYFKRKLHKTKINDWRKYDLIADYRENNNNLEHELKVQEEMRNFEKVQHKIGTTKKRILRSSSRTN